MLQTDRFMLITSRLRATVSHLTNSGVCR